MMNVFLKVFYKKIYFATGKIKYKICKLLSLTKSAVSSVKDEWTPAIYGVGEFNTSTR
jgi:hypothetical protein